MGWYVKRNAEHKQPAAEPNMSFIEELGGFYVDKSHGDDNAEKVVYLTFDAGYENGNVAKILDALKAENVNAAFFILGNLVSKDLPLVKRMAEEGHLVCNHTYSHKDMTKCANYEEFEFEMRRMEEAYLEAMGSEICRYYRPPEGRFDRQSLEYANRMGYKTVFWSFAYADWDNSKQMSESDAMKKILDNIHNGAVLLLHPTSATNASIMRDLIRELKKDGYRFGTLDELVKNNEA